MPTYRMFGSATGLPTSSVIDTGNAHYTLATEFYVTQSGCSVTELWVYIADAQQQGEGIYVGLFRVSDHAQVVTAVPLSPSGTGWQKVVLGTPFALTANEHYKVAYTGSVSGTGTAFTTTASYWTAADKTNGALVMPKAANALGGGQGTFTAQTQAQSQAGTITWPGDPAGSDANYWLDVTVSAPGTPPTVNAGQDLTIETGTASFSIPGSATANDAGATISSYAWTQTAGTTVTLAGTTTNSVTITPPATAGSVTLQLTATDSNGTAGTDTVTITFVAPGQSLRPSGDVSNPGSWTGTPTASPLAANIDETAPSSTDYISSPDTPTSAVYTCSLPAGTSPGTTTGLVVEAMLWRDSAVASHTMSVALMQGTTVIATRDFTDLTTTPTLRQFTLTTAEAGAITDWTTLRLRFTATAA